MALDLTVGSSKKGSGAVDEQTKQTDKRVRFVDRTYAEVTRTSVENGRDVVPRPMKQ